MEAKQKIHWLKEKPAVYVCILPEASLKTEEYLSPFGSVVDVITDGSYPAVFTDKLYNVEVYVKSLFY